MTRQKGKPLPTGLEAVATIEPGNMDRPHLGNLGAMMGQLMQLLDRDREICVAAAAGMPWEEAHAKTVARIEALAAALLGQDPAFQHVPGWNEAGAIDAHLCTHLPSLDGPADKVVVDALARLVLLGRTLMEEPDPDVVAEMLRDTVLKLAQLLVGLRPQDAA